MSSGADSEEEIRAIMMQKAPISSSDFTDHFPGRFRSYEVYGVSCFVLLLHSFLAIDAKFCMTMLICLVTGHIFHCYFNSFQLQCCTL